ncbi:MAG: Rieske 2Fe-2S domain-containing protein [Myxococcota bacterium]
MAEARGYDAGARETLVPGEVRVVPLGLDAHGLPREALVLLDAEGTLRVWVNLCRHIPIPLDSGSREFWDRDRRQLICLTHGATYRLADGLCTAGPCKGERLQAVPHELRDGSIVLFEPPDPEDG